MLDIKIYFFTIVEVHNRPTLSEEEGGAARMTNDYLEGPSLLEQQSCYDNDAVSLLKKFAPPIGYSGFRKHRPMGDKRALDYVEQNIPIVPTAHT